MDCARGGRRGPVLNTSPRPCYLDSRCLKLKDKDARAQEGGGHKPGHAAKKDPEFMLLVYIQISIP